MKSQMGMVFDIQRFALHDGPGIRTTVFLKGCNNRCGWCHNPESLSLKPQIQYYPNRCVHCAACAAVCPVGAHAVGSDGHTFDHGACTGCGLCAEVCNAQAVVLSGRRQSAGEVMEVVLEDAAYYRSSGGGMTISGGEPVLQSEFCSALLSIAKENGIHTALETAGNYPFSKIEPLLGMLDLVLFDLKAWSERIYREHIHGNKAAMLETLTRLDEAGVPIIVRTPVVGGVNAALEEIGAIAQFAGGLKSIRHYQLIPYHSLGKAKYDSLGEAYDTPYETPSKEHMRALEKHAAAFVKVYNLEDGYIRKEGSR